MDKWYACLDGDRCFATVPEPVAWVNLTRPVGAGAGQLGGNRRDEVIKIQEALNQVPAAEGGATPSLDVDGICGPLTTGAIRRFQQVQFPGWPADARIDPGQKTLRRLNAILVRQSTVLPTPTNPHAVGQLPEIQKAYATVPEALARIRLARARLLSLRTTLTLPGSLTGSERERKVAEWNFKLHRADNPAAHLDRILGVYDRMHETLVMATRPGTSLQFFLSSNGNKLEDNAAAYTCLGGYYYGIGEVEDDGQVRYAVYITPQFVNKVFAASILIHEMAHFSGGKKNSPDTIEHRASPRPAPDGTRLEDGRHNYANMTADEAYRNAQSYQAYAFPEDLGKPPQ